MNQLMNSWLVGGDENATSLRWLIGNKSEWPKGSGPGFEFGIFFKLRNPERQTRSLRVIEAVDPGA